MEPPEPGPSPPGLTLLSSGSERVLAALGQEGAWTPVMEDQPKKNQASGSTTAQQEEGLGVQLGPCREGGPSPRPTPRTAPHPGAGRTLNRAQTLTGPDLEGGGKGPGPRVFSLLQLRRGRGPRAPGPKPPQGQAPEGCGVPGKCGPGHVTRVCCAHRRCCRIRACRRARRPSGPREPRSARPAPPAPPTLPTPRSRRWLRQASAEPRSPAPRAPAPTSPSPPPPPPSR